MLPYIAYMDPMGIEAMFLGYVQLGYDIRRYLIIEDDHWIG